MACSCVSQADNELKIKQHAGGSLPPGKFWNVLSIGPFRGLRREALSFQGAPLDALEGREYESPTRIRPGLSIESRFSTDPGRQAQAAQMPAGLGRTARDMTRREVGALDPEPASIGQCHATFLADYSLGTPALAGGFMAF